MGRARLGDDGRYHGDLPCGWCETLIDQKGRRRPRRYCGPWHRTKSYAAKVTALIADLF